MKICFQCKRELALSEFNKRGDGLQPWCRDCNKARSRQYYAENKDKHRKVMQEKNKKYRRRNKEFIHAAKDVPCLDCGVKYPPYVMDFDHLSDKAFDIAQAAGSGLSIELLQKEIDKCEVVCSNCHRERTYARQAALV